MDRQTYVSKNFALSEFGGVRPDPLLVAALQCLRDDLRRPIKIMNGPRTIEEHIAIYKKLSDEGKLATLENGKGDKSLIDCIPWGSRHLPTHDYPCLRAVDFTVHREGKGMYTGNAIYDIMKPMLEEIREVYPHLHTGIGIGKEFIHLDVDRERDTVWRYDY